MNGKSRARPSTSPHSRPGPDSSALEDVKTLAEIDAHVARSDAAVVKSGDDKATSGLLLDPDNTGTPSGNTTTSSRPPRPAQTTLAERRLSRQQVLQVSTDLSSDDADGRPNPASLTTSTTDLHLSGLSPMSFKSPHALHGSASTDNFANCLSPTSMTSALPSPALSAMIDLTPLPSPVIYGVGEGTPIRQNSLRAGYRRSSLGVRPLGDVSRSNSVNSHHTTFSPQKKKPYGSLLHTAVEGSATAPDDSSVTRHGRNRSISEFQPDTLQNVRPRVATFGPRGIKDEESTNGSSMQREEYLAGKRGIDNGNDTQLNKTLPSPPSSNRGTAESDEDDDVDNSLEHWPSEYFQFSSGTESTIQQTAGAKPRPRRWRRVKMIGQGTFSKVWLATAEELPDSAPVVERQLNPAKLVAVKICEHGPAGGADEERIKHGLEREIDILKSVSFPSLVHLIDLEQVPGRTFLVMTYCTGGDLFEMASSRKDILTTALVQRFFAELVGATRYLHENWIVHRDIKLENVLVNAPAASLTPSALPSPSTHPHPLITLTDLGLSRRISPADPLLTTRCGSEDYAAPELLLGQPYDGRSTDAWALGVLLYALMEARLPFDTPPGKVERSRNTHRIARCDWIWCRFGDEDGEWDPARGKGWEGARTVVEALLRKVRMGRKGLDAIAQMDWVRGGVEVDGDLRRRASVVDGGQAIS